MGIITLQYATLLVLLLLSCLETGHGAPTFSCREDERIALLQFKASVNDSHGRQTSWVGRDCCSWSGVACDNRTSHVTRLDLGIDLGTGNDIEGHEINPCLLGLPKLSYLDLRSNIFNDAPFPKFIGSFKILSYLDLSATGIAGRVPPELGNLSSLHHLDLSFNIGLEIEDSAWLSNLSSLEYLDLSGISIRKPSDALQSLGMLPVLSELHLASFSLTPIPRKLPSANFTSLSVHDLSYSSYFNTTLPKWPFEIVSLKNLDLSNNNFNGIVPSSMGNLTSLDLSHNEFLERDSLNSAIAKISTLTTLKLSSMKLKGQLPLWLGDLKNLEYLDLSSNNLSGTLPASLIGELSRLVALDLSSNQLNGNLPATLGLLSRLVVLDLSDNQLDGNLSASLGLLSRLVELDLSGNSFDGSATETHFRNLINLKTLDLSGNSLTIDIKPERTPPWQLEHLNLGDCKVGPVFPAWLREMENISFIAMSNAGISGVMPDWFWNFSLNISDVDMSNNMIKGRLPTSLRHLNHLVSLFMSNNQLEGQIPQLPTELEFLTLSNNLISGSIPRNIGEASSIMYLGVSANKLSGSIPSSICKLKELQLLYLSHNQLLGQVPNCWGSLSTLRSIDLSNNDLSGSVPTSICSGSSLETLYLNSNNLSGGIHLALRNCSTLEVLDMGNNKLSGSIPTWLGRRLTRLVILRLQSNMFVGKIPANLGNLSSLVVIDLSHNILSGSIPPSFANLSAMKDSVLTRPMYDYSGDTIYITIKGREEDYSIKSINVIGTKINLPVTIDLSSNILSGEFPEILTVLHALQNLNLSRNNLTGNIPRTIDGLQNLESLDLSFNKLTGEIPSTMSTLTFLSAMNFSFNDFSGRIPTGGQFDSHPYSSIYMGNDHLCGFPLNSICGGNLTHSPNLNTYSDDETDDEDIWFYASAALGFVTGFWALVGSLLLKRKWRIASYQCIDHAYDKLYGNVIMNLFKISQIYDA